MKKGLLISSHNRIFIILLFWTILGFVLVNAEEFKSCYQNSDCKVDICNQNSCVNQSYPASECTSHNFAAEECYCVNNICEVLVGSVVPVCDAENSDTTYCKDEKTMMVCSSGNWVSKPCVYKCAGTECIAGCYRNEDCGGSYIKGYCSDNQFCSNTVTPVCLDSGICSSSSVSKCTACANGCKEGRCIGETQQQTEKTLQSTVETQQPATSKCSDTDGGINYYEKGSTMWGSDISSTDSCDDGITLREESCVPNPGPNEGTMLTSKYKCPNGCKDGACIKGEKQREEVKCVFKNTQTEQKCYRAELNWMYCAGQGSCIVTNLEGYDMEKITWKSSCGGYAYTMLDGNNEYAEFECSGITGNFCQSKQCDDGSWTKCYVDGSGYCVCSACSVIIIKPVCGNGVCESGEGQFCEITSKTCEAGKECKISQAKCFYSCEQDCRGIEGIQAKLNEKFKSQVSQTVEIIDYKNIKINFRDLITQKCEAATTNTEEVKQKLTGMAVAEEIQSSESEDGGGTGISIIKCPDAGPMAQLEIMNPEERGNKILTLKTGEAKNVYGVSVSFLEYDFASRTGVFIVNSETSDCPENCKCDNQGYVLECKTEEKCEQGKMLCPDGICREKCEIINLRLEGCQSGCIYENKCLPIGVRVKGLYCSIDVTLTNQLNSDEACENNFECSSNVCVSGKCISEGFIKKILNWFKKLFGD